MASTPRNPQPSHCTAPLPTRLLRSPWALLQPAGRTGLATALTATLATPLMLGSPAWAGADYSLGAAANSAPSSANTSTVTSSSNADAGLTLERSKRSARLGERLSERASQWAVGADSVRLGAAWSLRADTWGSGGLALPEGAGDGSLAGLSGREGLTATTALRAATDAAGNRLLPSQTALLGSYVLLGQRSGLRATGGVVDLGRNLRNGSAGLLGYGSSLERLAAADGVQTLPYLGLGYSSHGLSGPSSNPSAWGLSADLGMLATSPRSAVRLGQQALDATLRDLRLSPVLQLGFSYTY